MLNFWVIKAVTAYNAILGRMGINVFQAVASTYHMKLKFPTKNDIGMEEGDQKLARSCYVTALKAGGKLFPLKTWMLEKMKKGEEKSAEDLIPIPLDPEDPTKVTYIGASFQGPSKEKLTKFLQENSDVFAWTAADMPGIDPQLITHKLNMESLEKADQTK